MNNDVVFTLMGSGLGAGLLVGAVISLLNSWLP